MNLYLVFILCTWTWHLVHGRSWVWFMSPYVTVSPRFFIYIWLFWRASIIVIQSHGRVMYSTNERERESGDLLFSRYSTHIYIICYIAKLLNYFYISYNFSKRMFVQKIIYIFVHFLWQSICIYTDWVRFSMECQHHFDRAYIYTHHVHHHYAGVRGDKTTTRRSYFYCCQLVWRLLNGQTNTFQKVTFEIGSLKNLTFWLRITNIPVTFITPRSSPSSP